MRATARSAFKLGTPRSGNCILGHHPTSAIIHVPPWCSSRFPNGSIDPNPVFWAEKPVSKAIPLVFTFVKGKYQLRVFGITFEKLSAFLSNNFNETFVKLKQRSVAILNGYLYVTYTLLLSQDQHCLLKI